MIRSRLGRALILSGLFVMTAEARATGVDVLSLCERAGQEAEQEAGVPTGLLLAIGRVESGRWDQTLGRVTPWPWAVDVAGTGRHPGSKDEAIRLVEEARTAGTRNIDVGCFQVNLLHHPNAFSDLHQAFDPATNARYAARLLVSLKQRLGGWSEAVEAYHSANPAHGIPYGRAVMASLKEAGEVKPQAVAQSYTAFGMTVWTPTRGGAAPSMIAIESRPTTQIALPRITTPSR